eukprot:TRINITY_DN5169_c0_g1_i1.p1 TRINITY_DN5169_c0_g1~~TRINITY_DN5169_c0_g1_i1.p1  ORF type:complete len:134 (+),score=11.55 TRINITY_DN5169_c0_g1_i1:626-1027(+)
MAHSHTHSTRELTTGVSKKGEHGAFDLLILSPSLHNGTIIDTVDKDFSDALGFQLSLFCQISRNLDRRSAWRERSWKTKDDDLLTFASLSHHHTFDWVETFVHSDVGECVTYLDWWALCLQAIAASLCVSHPQ